MLELVHADATHLAIGVAGDTLNAAVYFKRAAPAIATSYLTALGQDPYSELIKDFCSTQSIDISMVQRLPGELPGICIVNNDSAGERTFNYWRAQSAFRKLFDDREHLFAQLAQFSCIYLSGITLAVTPQQYHAPLLAALQHAAGLGSQIVFDPNYRARLWKSADIASSVMSPFIDLAHNFYTSDEDLALLYGLPVDTDTLSAFAENLIIKNKSGDRKKEIVIRRGKHACLISNGADKITVEAVTAVQVDSTGAGDSFNGTYFASRLTGDDVEVAAQKAHKVAARVIGHKGAILPLV